MSARERVRRDVLAALREAGGWDRHALYAFGRRAGLAQAEVFAALAKLEDRGKARHVPKTETNPERWEVAA